MANPGCVQERTSSLTATTDIFVMWKSDPYTSSDDGFNNWDKIVTLVVSNLEAHALDIGDLTDEDMADHDLPQQYESHPMEEDEQNYSSQVSLASDDEFMEETDG
ncbi:uncharacterized protein K460DRAFT_359205 [Cucurbitaria berberidis CBS 394.84]|uniref:Uncharacterized protein n=1 Tax=Cucurbitaria berberidis CBS 394.84 TaxID=1168544 RepID=A0A9P4L625_9PLEO|nr:uncharacterized protein K460DRAFT_359205 [Cucurbitaria berberidis CBS 394.84]KAF1842633.1 hypothetical protein K460DRAFT_359205 [Cucurbitaria berberidis CBS 394.84]